LKKERILRKKFTQFYLIAHTDICGDGMLHVSLNFKDNFDDGNPLIKISDIGHAKSQFFRQRGPVDFAVN